MLVHRREYCASAQEPNLCWRTGETTVLIICQNPLCPGSECCGRKQSSFSPSSISPASQNASLSGKRERARASERGWGQGQGRTKDAIKFSAHHQGRPFHMQSAGPRSGPRGTPTITAGAAAFAAAAADPLSL